MLKCQQLAEYQKKSIPYSQAFRIRRICSTTERYWDAAKMLLENLTARGYPKRMIQSALEKAVRKDRSMLLDTSKPQTVKGNNLIPFITTYNPYNPPIDQILGSNKRILNTSGELQTILDSKLFVVNIRATNLQDSG